MPALNKVFEKLIYNRLAKFFKKYKIINNNQFGFREGHSTELAIAKFYEDTLTYLDNNEACCAILLDLSKAFDSVDRDILLYKLKKYGIRGKPYQLLHSYLNNRYQYVQVNNIKSNLFPSKFGVPQGSIISPLLFLILINDLKSCTNMEVINFADDTLLYHKINNPNNAQQWINNEFNIVSNWTSKNHLKLNIKKTHLIIFSSNSIKFKSLENLSITSNNNTIQQTNNCKYLGLIIDNKFNWTDHIQKLKIQLSKIVGILYRIRYFLNKCSLNLILNSLILSKLNYGIICYGRATKSAIRPIQIILNRALRCINYLKRQDKKTSLVYYQQGVLQIQDLFKLQVAKFCYKANKNLLPSIFGQIFIKTSTIHQYSTRNSANKFYRISYNKTSGCNRLQNLGSKIWNEIPDELKDCKSIGTFVEKYKKLLIKKYLDF